MKKKFKQLSIGVIIVIIVTNIPPVNTWIDLIVDQYHYCYSNADGTVTHIHDFFKGGPFYVPKVLSTVKVERIPDTMGLGPYYKVLPPGTDLRNHYPGADTVMYRLFWKNPLTFWRWRDYVFNNEKYNFPYKSWIEIKKHRRIHQAENSTFQDF